MVWTESPLVPPQEIRIVDIRFGFQPNTFFDQELMERDYEFRADDQQNRLSSTTVIPVAIACSAVSKVWRNFISAYSTVPEALVNVLKPPIHKRNTWWQRHENVLNAP